jgi:hypothetical protein
MERDEVYVPKTRSDLGLPAVGKADENAYEELLGDTPIYTLFMLVRQQLLAFPAYLRTSHSRSQCLYAHRKQSSTSLAKRRIRSGLIILILDRFCLLLLSA